MSSHVTRGASDIVSAEKSGQNPWSTQGLVSNPFHLWVNKTKQLERAVRSECYQNRIILEARLARSTCKIGLGAPKEAND